VSDYPLSERDRDEFLRLTTEKGEEFILDLDTALAKIVDPEGSLRGKRYGVGVYFFQEQSTSAQAPSQSRRTSSEAQSSSRQVREEIDVLAPPRRTS
jgi:hypothetical protein